MFCVDCNINSGFCSVFTWSIYLSLFMGYSTRNTIWRHWPDWYTLIYINKFLLNILYCFLLYSYKPFLDFHTTFFWICTLMSLKFILESVTFYTTFSWQRIYISHNGLCCGLISDSNSVIACTIMLYNVQCSRYWLKYSVPLQRWMEFDMCYLNIFLFLWC